MKILSNLLRNKGPSGVTIQPVWTRHARKNPEQQNQYNKQEEEDQEYGDWTMGVRGWTSRASGRIRWRSRVEKPEAHTWHESFGKWKKCHQICTNGRDILQWSIIPKRPKRWNEIGFYRRFWHQLMLDRAKYCLFTLRSRLEHNFVNNALWWGKIENDDCRFWPKLTRDI